jgi:hypothetical protein
MFQPPERVTHGPRLSSGSAGTCDTEEGIDAFIHKRKPVWKDS